MSPSNRPIVICGAGPVGLLLGNLLGKAGLSVVILEQRL
ncbi:MAG: FAD-dependent monooxygenase, partial [Phycisphaeraceae bacterium]|nr:FAD-dependent monooxygenase [Phycisphaeraceae bacterium]